MKQRKFCRYRIEPKQEIESVSIKLEKIEKAVNWEAVVKLVKIVDKTSRIAGGAQHRDLLTKNAVFTAII